MATKEEMKRVITILQYVMAEDAEGKICCSAAASKMLGGLLSMPAEFPDDHKGRLCESGETYLDRVASHLAKAVSGKHFPELPA